MGQFFLLLAVLMFCTAAVSSLDTFLIYDIKTIDFRGQPTQQPSSTIYVFNNTMEAQNAIYNVLNAQGANGVNITNICANPARNPCHALATCYELQASLIQCTCNMGYQQNVRGTAYPPKNIVPEGTDCRVAAPTTSAAMSTTNLFAATSFPSIPPGSTAAQTAATSDSGQLSSLATTMKMSSVMASATNAAPISSRPSSKATTSAIISTTAAAASASPISLPARTSSAVISATNPLTTASLPFKASTSGTTNPATIAFNGQFPSTAATSAVLSKTASATNAPLNLTPTPITTASVSATTQFVATSNPFSALSFTTSKYVENQTTPSRFGKLSSTAAMFAMNSTIASTVGAAPVSTPATTTSATTSLATTTIPFTSTSLGMAFCSPQSLQDISTNKTYNFSRSIIGDVPLSLQSCANKGRAATAECLTSSSNPSLAILTNLYAFNCSTRLDSLRPIVAENINTTSAASTISNLRILTSNLQSLTKLETNRLTDTLTVLSNTDPNIVKVNIPTLLNAMLTINNVAPHLAYSKNSAVDAQKSKMALISALENFSDRVILPANQSNITLITKDITLQIVDLDTKTGKQYSDVTFQPVDSQGVPYIPPVTATISGALLNEVSQKQNKGKIRVSFTTFQNGNLFDGNTDTSQIISTRIRNYKPVKVTDSVTITFNNITARQGSKTLPNNSLKENVTRTQCVYWNTKNSQWSPDKVRLATTTSTNAPTCQSSQLANFAMIVSSVVLPSAFELRITSLVGCTLSIIGLVATIAIFLGIRVLRTKKPSIFLINICVCLLFVNIIFVSGSAESKKLVACYFVSALMHYFLLATWLWMTINAYNMYKCLVKVVGTSMTSPKLASLICYVTPLAIIIVNGGVAIFHNDVPRYRPDDNLFVSSYRARHMCWLHLHSLNFGFLLPIGILGLANLIFFCLVFVNLTCKRNEIRSTAQKRTRRDDFLVAVTLILMMGLTWIFGFLMLVADDVYYQTVMAWCFTIVNTSQGFFIFLINCVRKQNVRSLWWNAVKNKLSCSVKKTDQEASFGVVNSLQATHSTEL